MKQNRDIPSTIVIPRQQRNLKATNRGPRHNNLPRLVALIITLLGHFRATDPCPDIFTIQISMCI